MADDVRFDYEVVGEAEAKDYEGGAKPLQIIITKGDSRFTGAQHPIKVVTYTKHGSSEGGGTTLDEVADRLRRKHVEGRDGGAPNAALLYVSQDLGGVTAAHEMAIRLNIPKVCVLDGKKEPGKKV